METITDFMNGFFACRNTEEELYLKSRESFRQKFYTNDCLWDSRFGTLEMNKSEAVVLVEESESEARVITNHRFQFRAVATEFRLRYHLELRNNNWIIRRVESECPACRGAGDNSCIICGGKHWLPGTLDK